MGDDNAAINVHTFKPASDHFQDIVGAGPYSTHQECTAFIRIDALKKICGPQTFLMAYKNGAAPHHPGSISILDTKLGNSVNNI